MSLFVVHYAYSAETANERSLVRHEHAKYLASLQQDGALVLSGPYTDGTGALFLVRADSAQSCSAYFDDDPFWSAGLVEGRAVRQFLVGFGLPDETDRVMVPSPTR